MTDLSPDPTPTPLPSQEQPVVTPEVVKAATRIVRARAFLSRQLKSTVPAAAVGSLTTLAVQTIRSRRQDSEPVYDNVSDNTTE